MLRLILLATILTLTAAGVAGHLARRYLRHPRKAPRDVNP